MAKECYFCNKSSLKGNNISRAKNKSKRRFKPNLQRVKIKEEGKTKKVYVCTRCIKAGKTITY